VLDPTPRVLGLRSAATLSLANFFMRYQRILPNTSLTPYMGPRPFAAIVAVEEDVEPQWQWEMSRWLVDSGCLYMMAWGVNCSSWDDSVDYANLIAFDGQEIPDGKAVMTTWHEGATLVEVFDFAKRHARPGSDDVRLLDMVVFHISHVDKKAEYESLFANA
jgi:hypothetical protein